ncbi:hypothetical protein NMG60_11006778 [Bertholletia excelsa]
MALNVSRNSIFPTHTLEDSLFSAIKFGNGHLMERFSDGSFGFGNYMNLNWKLENPPDSRWDKTENVPDDILDLLPPDPFGMDLSSTFTAITGWLEDIENDLGLSSLGFVTDRAEMRTAEDQLFSGLNLVWNSGRKFHTDVDNSKVRQSWNGHGKELPVGAPDGGFVLEANTKEFMGLSYEKYSFSADADNEFEGCTEVKSDANEGAPHDALVFALGYLGVRDLLSIEGVCRSLRDGVRNDPLLWRNIHIGQPLNEKITDDALLQLTSRAQGTLHCLSLVECLRITDRGLRRALESNPGLTKLSVPGCVRLSVEGILCNLRALKSAGKLGIKHLRIGGLYGITNEQYKELQSLLGADNHSQLSAHKPRFYGSGQLYLSCDDDRAIDIETCPKCQNLRQVYDCPADSCQEKHQTNQLCRACTFCIARCFLCGQCINGGDYEETFCLDSTCLHCWKQISDVQDGRKEEMDVHSI